MSGGSSELIPGLPLSREQALRLPGMRLYRLVVNTAMDWKKANRAHAEIPETVSGAADAEKDLQTKEALEQVLALPEKEKTALLLVFGEGMTHAEAAFVMACKESTVSWYIHEARKKLGVKETKKEARHG